ncbi:MAG: M23 family metallopeptidase [Acidobacteriota bacterium]|nr:M23 family metallopeptidase [Acidobacteriota bacterium]
MSALTVAPPVAAQIVLPPPPISIIGAEPVDEGSLVFETVARKSQQNQPRFLVSLDLFLKNLGTVSYRLERVRYQFLYRDLLSLPQEKCVSFELEAGESRKYIFPFEGSLTAAPYFLKVELYFEGEPTPLMRSFPLEPYESPLAGNVIGLPGGEPPSRAHHYPFPARPEDLLEGEYWATGQNHQLGSNHRGSSSQRFAYDLKVVGWDPGLGEWSSIHPGVFGDQNYHYRVWGKPVYALSTGVVLWCDRTEPDNPSPPQMLPGGLGGGNQIAILQENDELIYYAHFMEEQIPVDICQPGIKIEEGTFLGLVGNSGDSTGPHLHLHLGSWSGGGGRPLLFSGAYGIHRSLLDPDDPMAPWASVDNQAFGPGMAIYPDDSPPH